MEQSKEIIEHAAQMISYRILSEVEKMCDKRKMTKKELAAAVGTSASYITQLFRGTKAVNMEIMAKFEKTLDFQFRITAGKAIPIEWYNSQPVKPL